MVPTLPRLATIAVRARAPTLRALTFFATALLLAEWVRRNADSRGNLAAILVILLGAFMAAATLRGTSAARVADPPEIS